MQKCSSVTAILVFFVITSVQATIQCLRHQTVCNHETFCLKYAVAHPVCYRCTKTPEVRFGASRETGIVRTTCKLSTASDFKTVGYDCVRVSDDQPCLKKTEKLICNQQCVKYSS